MLRLPCQAIMCHMQGLWERVIRLTHKAARPNGCTWEAVVSFWMRLGPEPEQHLRPAGDELTQAGESATPALPSNCQSHVSSVFPHDRGTLHRWGSWEGLTSCIHNSGVGVGIWLNWRCEMIGVMVSAWKDMDQSICRDGTLSTQFVLLGVSTGSVLGEHIHPE